MIGGAIYGGLHVMERGEACWALFLGRCALGPQFVAAFASAETALNGGCEDEQRMEGAVIGVDGKRSLGMSHRGCGGDGLVW